MAKTKRRKILNSNFPKLLFNFRHGSRSGVGRAKNTVHRHQLRDRRTGKRRGKR